jgi:hypothetical protein
MTAPAPTFDPAKPWDAITLAISGFHRKGASSLRPVLQDWLGFIGGRPSEIVYVDGGSPPPTTRRLTALLHEGLIDRLELLNPSHWENSYDRCYIQEYRAGRLATKPFIMFVKLDMLPYRRGQADWLVQDLRALDDPHTFAITTSHLIDEPVARDGPYLAYDFASLNFAIMKRESWEAAAREQMGDLIDSNFRGPYPPGIKVEERWRRALIEWVWQAHCRQQGMRTLARAESPDWTIFHINKSGRKLLWLRKRYLAREGVEEFFDRPKMLYRPPHTAPQRVGRSIENAFRSLRGGAKAKATPTNTAP